MFDFIFCIFLLFFDQFEKLYYSGIIFKKLKEFFEYDFYTF